MASLTGNDLKRLEDLIISGQKANETRLSALQSDTNEIKADLKTLEKRLTALEIGQAEIKGDIKALDTKVDGIDSRLERVENEQGTLVKDISDLKGAKSLIIPIIVAVTTSLVTLLIRSLPNP